MKATPGPAANLALILAGLAAMATIATTRTGGSIMTQAGRRPGNRVRQPLNRS